MPSSRIPSPARSQGVISTPRRAKLRRRTRSVCSPTQSNVSVRLSTLVSDSYKLSPFPKRQSVLTDETDIEIVPGRQSWWKKLGDCSRDVMDVLESKDMAEIKNVADEFDVEVLSQEKQDYTLDLPESSDGESISSIVIPQRKLFTQKEQNPQTKYAQILNNRESQSKHKSHTDHDKDIEVAPKNLFSQPSKPRTKPVFPAALLNISSNKTLNKTKEMPVAEVKGQVRSLFGNRPGTKRKNMFADFIASDSEDDIPDIQPKVFGFQKNVNVDNKPQEKSSSQTLHHSPTSSIDLELDDWNLLPSSTMVGNQLEETTPVKRARLSKLSEVKETETMSTINKTLNKTKQSNKSNIAKNKSKISSNSKLECESSKLQDKINVNGQSDDQSINNSTSRLTRNKSKSIHETSLMQANHSKTINKSKNTTRKNQSRTNKVNDNQESLLQDEGNIQNELLLNEGEDDEDFTLEYENDDEQNNECLDNNDNNRRQFKDKNDTMKQASNKKTESKEKQNVNEMTNKNSYNEQENTNEIPQNNINLNVDMPDGNVTEKPVQLNNKQANQYIDDDEKLSESLNVKNKSNVSKHNTSKKHNKSKNKQNEKVEAENEFNQINQNNTRQNINSQSKSNNVSQEMEHEGDNKDESKNISEENIEDNEDNEQTDAEENEEENESNEQNNTETNEEENVSSVQNNTEENEEITSDVEDQSKSHEIQNESREGELVQNDSELEKNESNMQNETEEIEKNQGLNRSKKGEEGDFNNVKPDEEGVISNHEEEENESTLNKTDEQHNQSIEIDVNDENEEHDMESEDQDEENEEQNIQNEDVESDDQEIENEDQDVENEEKEDDDEENESSVNQTDEQENESAEIDENEENDEENEEQDMENEDQDVEDDEAEIENDDQESNDSEVEESDNEGNEDDNEEVNHDGPIGAENDNEDEEGTENENDESPNITHDTTGKHRNIQKVTSPEAILHDKTNQIDSFMAEGRNTSVRKTKSILVKTLNIRPSLAPVRESTGFSDGTRNSSADNSGWDSHRTTRKTLRQTFGKDFTPRKSLRALVMEKSAKRRTDFIEKQADLTENVDNAKIPQANSTELPHFDSYEEPENVHVDETAEESDYVNQHEMSKRTRQTTLEMYLQKIQQDNLERKRKIEEQVKNSLKTTTQTYNLFKVPRKPVRRVQAESKPRQKQTRPLIFMDMLPAEVVEDMKYKPPKRFKPNNASWITKRLYKFLETKLEPNYNYKARVRSEKLVETLYNFTKDVRKHHVAPMQMVDTLKHEMARLNIVKTHFDFYEFFQEYLPREIRIKVIPDVVNNISLPKHGVFADIIR